MGRPRTKPLKSTKYQRDLEQMIVGYCKATGNREWTRLAVAEWAIKNNFWEQRKQSAVQELMRHLQAAARAVFITDDEEIGKVRKYHAVKVSKQLTLWAAIEDMTPENIHSSLQSRNDIHYGGVKQMDRDVRYYNKHINPGDPVQLSFNYDARLADELHSAEYVDRPPPEVQGGDDEATDPKLPR